MYEPEGSELITGEIADYRMGNDGILYSYSKSPVRTVANISANVELVKKITGSKTVPLLIYLSKSPVPDKETRAFAAQQLPKIYKAVAMVSKGGLAAFIMGILFKLKPSPIPMKAFSSDEEAREWLKQYV